MVSSPRPPDPEKTAAAQGTMNRETAITQQQLNMINQVGPDGSLIYSQQGTNRFKDSKGNWVETPKYTATTTLSKAQQAIKNQTDAASLNLGTIANERTGFLKDYLSKPFDVNAETESKLYDLGSKRLDPRFAQEQDALRAQLISSGVRPGTAAYDQQMSQFGQTKNDAYNQLALNGRQQAFQEASYERAQPLNEISALLGSSQVSMPQFQQTPQSSVGGVDYTGLVNNQYQARVGAANATNNALGGLFGLAGKFAFSDRRLKRDIHLIGERNGLPWYQFNYVWDSADDAPREGVMSDDVRRIMPNAVVTDARSGFDMVDYSAVTEA